MSLPSHKKRYKISLTIENVDRLKSLLKYFGLPVNSMSISLDNSLVSIADCLQAEKDKGGLNGDVYWDLFVDKKSDDFIETNLFDNKI